MQHWRNNKAAAALTKSYRILGDFGQKRRITDGDYQMITDGLTKARRKGDGYNIAVIFADLRAIKGDSSDDAPMETQMPPLLRFGGDGR